MPSRGVVRLLPAILADLALELHGTLILDSVLIDGAPAGERALDYHLSRAPGGPMLARIRDIATGHEIAYDGDGGSGAFAELIERCAGD